MADETVADSELIRRAQAGHEAAFGALRDRYAHRLGAFIRRQIAPALLRKISVADLSQETFLAAFQQLDRFEDRGPGAFWSWLAKLAHHRILHAARRFTGTAKRGGVAEVSRDDRCATANFAGRGPTPSQLAIAGETRERAKKIVASLPADYREVLRLRQQEHLTLEETARRMGRSKGAVNKLYARALAKLSEGLGLRRRP